MCITLYIASIFGVVEPIISNIVGPGLGAREHVLAVTRNYITQPRLSELNVAAE